MSSKTTTTTTVEVNNGVTKLVTFKNHIMIGDATSLLPLKEFKMSDLPKGQLHFYVNTQWLSKDNRIKFNIMSEGHDVTRNGVDPKIVDNREEYFVLAQQPKSTTRSKTMEMSKEDVTKLNELLTSYNKATLTKEIVKLTIKL